MNFIESENQVKKSKTTKNIIPYTAVKIPNNRSEFSSALFLVVINSSIFLGKIIIKIPIIITIVQNSICIIR